MIDLSTAISGLRAAQIGLQTASQNITNANTDGYTRQVVDLRNRAPVNLQGTLVGAGVEVSQIRRLVDQHVQSSLIANQGNLSALNARSSAARQFELLMAPDSGGIGQRISDLQVALTDLNGATQDLTVRRAFIDKAKQLADSISNAANQLQTTRESIVGELQATVDDINKTAQELTRVNEEIRISVAKQQVPNDLYDRRDILLGKLGSLIDTKVNYTTARGDVSVLQLPSIQLGNGEYRLGETAPDFSLKSETDGTLSLYIDRREVSVNVLEGKLGGLLDVYNKQIPDNLQQLDTLAHNIMGTVDSIHASGVTGPGGFKQLFGARGLLETSTPLESAAVKGFPLKSGRIYVGIIDQTTMTRTLHAVDVDVTTDSLETVATKIAAVGHIQANVDPGRKTLALAADPGYGFDFSGVPSSQFVAGWTGTTAITMSGAYANASNKAISLKVVGSGTVGLTPNLKVNVLDSSGNLLRSLDVGSNYAPGAPLELADGMTIAFGSGTLVDGESSNATLVGQPDETGLLAATGINSLFTGKQATDMAVRKEMLASPQNLAVSSTGLPGNIVPLSRLLQALDPETPNSLTEQAADLTGRAANKVADLNLMTDNAKFVDQSLGAERDAVSGVNTDEELVRILEFQRAFQAASRVILTSDDMFQDLLSMLR